jgi:hypothetical protein
LDAMIALQSSTTTTKQSRMNDISLSLSLTGTHWHSTARHSFTRSKLITQSAYYRAILASGQKGAACGYSLGDNIVTDT